MKLRTDLRLVPRLITRHLQLSFIMSLGSAQNKYISSLCLGIFRLVSVSYTRKNTQLGSSSYQENEDLIK
jgi:hypothetical protein